MSGDFDVEGWLAERRVDPSGLTWDDFVGSEPAKREIRNLLARLVHRDDLEAAGMAIPKGILVHGEPGSGKTYLTRVMAAELLRAVPDVAFFEINAAELDSVERLEIVMSALRAMPGMIIVTLDEADMFGLARWGNSQTYETRSILLAFLSALDGLRAVTNVFWILTANSEIDSFDPAVVRPGRIEIGIPLGRPSSADRLKLFEYYATKVPCDPSLSLEIASELLGPAMPAKVRGVMADAYALALAAGGRQVTPATMIDAIRRDGIAYDALTPGAESRARAIHEAGHAIIAAVLGQRPTLVVIDRHGGGRTTTDDEGDEEGDSLSWSRLRSAVLVGYAGLEAERMILGDDGVTLGSSADLSKLTDTTQRALDSGLVPGILPLPDSSLPGSYPENRTSRAVERILLELQPKAVALVREHREPIERFAQILIRERHLAGASLRSALAEALGETLGTPKG